MYYEKNNIYQYEYLCSECKSSIYSIMRCQYDINTEHNMKSIGRAAVAQWTKRLTRNGQTRVRIREAHIFEAYICLRKISFNYEQVYCTSTLVSIKYSNTVLLLISRARKIVTKFHNYSYEIVMSPVIVNSYKNGHNSYQIVK